MSALDRDGKIAALMSAMFSRAEKSGAISIQNNLRADVEILFDTTSWGFREMLLLVALVRSIDPSYRASRSLYSCNPRAVFEGPIVRALRSRNIPTRKSGPLNIAKAAEGLDSKWAAQRRPKEAADALVRLVRRIESMSVAELSTLTAYVHQRFLAEARRVAAITRNVDATSDPARLSELCRDLITQVPDAGNTAQRIVGLLLETMHDDEVTGTVVVGHEDRASVTSTTSKKPGDITEERPAGQIVRVYEVTTKPFGDARVTDSVETVAAFSAHSGQEILEVLVLCRPQDVIHASAGPQAQAAVFLATLEAGGIDYRFIDIFGWIDAQLLRMTSAARTAFFQALATYVAAPDTAEKVKRRWIDVVR